MVEEEREGVSVPSADQTALPAAPPSATREQQTRWLSTAETELDNTARGAVFLLCVFDLFFDSFFPFYRLTTDRGLQGRPFSGAKPQADDRRQRGREYVSA